MKILILLPVQPKIAKGKSKSFLSIILVWVLLPLPHLFLVLPSHLASHEVPRLRKKWTPAQICIQSDTELDTEMWHNMGQRSMCQLSDCNILVTGHKSRTKHNVYPACMNMAHYQNPGLRNTETIFSSNERSPQEKKKKKEMSHSHTSLFKITAYQHVSPEMFPSITHQAASTYAILQACAWPQQALR